MRQPMRSFAALITLCLVSSVTMAQELLITPKWKRDDTRTLYMTQKQTMPGVNEEGEIVEVVNNYKTSSKVKVYDISPEAVMITVDHENIVIPIVRPYFTTGLPNEMDPYKRMVIRYRVDRQTGVSVLLNATDLLEFTQRATNISLRSLRKTDPNAAAEIEQRLAPMLEQFNDPLKVDEFFGQYFSFLTDAFGKPLVQGQPLEQVEMKAEPFSASGDSLAVKTITSLENATSDQATVKIVQSLATAPQTAAGKGTQKARPANDAFSISTYSQEVSFTLDLKTTWPIRMHSNSTVTLSNGIALSEVLDIDVR